MRAQDIEPGGVYLAGRDGVRRWGTRGKARVVGPGKASDVPRGRRGSGHRYWEVEWLAPYHEGGRDRIDVGSRSTVPSAWLFEPWTDEHEGAAAREQARMTHAAGLSGRLAKAAGLADITGDTFYRGDRPTFHVRGQATDHPSWTLTGPAVERLLGLLEATGDGR